MVIYLITNLINNKKYVGLTKRNVKVRWYEHVKKSKSKNLSELSLHHDISLYGKNNFNFEVLKECSSISELCEFEKIYIKELDSIKNGYNLNTGGKHYELSNKLKEKMSVKSNTSREVFIFDKSGNYINSYISVNKACRELNIDPRKAFRVLSGKRKSCDGYVFSYKNKISILDKRSVKVYKYDSDKNLLREYISINECAKIEKIDRSYLGKIIYKEYNYIKGFYYSDKKEFTSIVKKMIYCYKNGNFINKFKNLKEASEETGINKSTISKILSGNRKSKFTFIWK